eukprot:TRINITY_DN5067_c0_g1_i6.p1 TRINITY_DN5067_c0_g1~~TRINITY_DN5067_c0_g1_i6.p1  ORF type:complete len:688 (+),score=207.95 TRINITY_DN5067_c0_g1_i6:112-2175(+)
MQVLSLNLLMDLVAVECELHANNHRTAFTTHLYRHVITYVLVNTKLSDLLLAELTQKYLAHYDDLRFFALSLINDLLSRPWQSWVSLALSRLQRPLVLRSSGAQKTISKPARLHLQDAEDEAEEKAAKKRRGSGHEAADDEEEEDEEEEVKEEQPESHAYFQAFSKNLLQVLLHFQSGTPLTETYFANGDKESVSEDKQSEGASKKRKQASGVALDRGDAGRVDRQHRMLARVWLAFLKLPLPMSVYKTVLLKLPTHLLPLLQNTSGAHHQKEFSNSSTSPLLLADFLTDSYNLGGVISLLSLHGLFILMQDYNLDYPNFYNKLYALLQPHVFHAKYRQRFFKLLDTFLSSTYIPVYLVAAFIKRLCYLCLTAPPSASYYAMALIFNLIRRHPATLPLIHRPSKPLTTLPASILAIIAAHPSTSTESPAAIAAAAAAAAAVRADTIRTAQRAAAAVVASSKKKQGFEIPDSKASDESRVVEEEKAAVVAESEPELEGLEVNDEIDDGEIQDVTGVDDSDAEDEEQPVVGAEADDSDLEASDDAEEPAALGDDADDDDQEEDEEKAEQRSKVEEAMKQFLRTEEMKGTDPYLPHQDQPQQCQAMASSLWEIKSLCNHYVYAVAKQAKIFEAPNAPRGEYNISEFITQTYNTMMEDEIKQKGEAKPALASHKPTSLFQNSQNHFSSWNM